MPSVWLDVSTGRLANGVDGLTQLDDSQPLDDFLGLYFDQMTKVFTYTDYYNYWDTLREKEAYLVVKALYDSIGMSTTVPEDINAINEASAAMGELPQMWLINALREGIKQITDLYYDAGGYGVAPNTNMVQQFSYYDANAIEVTLQALHDKIDRLSVVKKIVGTFYSGQQFAL